MSRKNFLIILTLFVAVLVLVGYFVYLSKKNKKPEPGPTEFEVNEALIIQELIEAEIPKDAPVKSEAEIVKDLVNVAPPKLPEGETKTEEEILDSLINLTP